MTNFSVRPATTEDWQVVVDFNCRLARESENKRLDTAAVRAGVQALLDDPAKGRYFVACFGERIVGQMMHTWEWSDWRNGQIWWLQSVYVDPEFRRQGVFRLLFEHIRREAEADENVVGLRLYVENANQAAHDTYRRMGMNATGYSVMETLFS